MPRYFGLSFDAAPQWLQDLGGILNLSQETLDSTINAAHERKYVACMAHSFHVHMFLVIWLIDVHSVM